MREELENLIISKAIDEGEKDSKDNLLKFDNFCKRKEITHRILADILKKRKEIPGKGILGFYSDEKDQLIGYLSDIYGCTAILSLVDKEKPDLSKEETAVLLENIKYIVNEIKEKGFTMHPYISDEDNKYVADGREETLFNKAYPYIGSMTWALSFLVSVRSARIRKAISDETHEEITIGYLDLDEVLLKNINSLIVRIVKHFTESVIFEEDENGETKYLGWSYTTGCETPSLFFTYSVLEAYSDFEDNVFEIETNEDGSYHIENGSLFRNYRDDCYDLREAFKNEAGGKETKISVWTRCCESVARNVWDVYKGVIGRDFVSDKFLEGFEIVKTEDLVKMDHTNALFNTVYLVCILLYGWANVLNEEESEEIVASMESALQNVQRVNDNLARRGLDYLVSTYTIPFTNYHKTRGNIYIRKLNYRRINDTTLLPILIKANNLIAFYITKYPVKKMDNLFKEIFDEDNICDNEILWDDKGYDVKITERYIEAINQFYDYYLAYEDDYNNKFKRQYSLAIGRGRALGKKVQEEANQANIEALKKQNEEALQAEREKFVIENAINARISSVVGSMFADYLEKINAKLLDDKVELNVQEERLYNVLMNLVRNYFHKMVKDISPEEDVDEMVNNMSKDLIQAILKWSEQAKDGKNLLDDIIQKSEEQDK